MLEERFFHDGGLIFDDEAPAGEAFIVRSGRVEISKEIEGRRVILSHIEAGQIFGEIGVLREHQKRTARAKACAATKLVVIPKTVFDNLLNSLDKMSRQIVVSLAARVEVTTRLKGFTRSEDPLRAFYDLIRLQASSSNEPLQATAMFKTFRRVLGIDRTMAIDILSKMHTLNLIQVQPSPRKPELIELVEHARIELLLRRLSEELGDRHFDFRHNEADFVSLRAAGQDLDMEEDAVLAAITAGKVELSDVYLSRAGLKSLTALAESDASESE